MTLQDVLSSKTWAPAAKQRFPLLKRLSIVSLLVMLSTAALLVFLYRHGQIAEHEEIAAASNERTLIYLLRSLNGQISEFVADSKQLDAQTLRANTKFDRLIASELDKINENDVLKLKIYNLAGTTIYSSAKNEIGGTSTHPELLTRALNGETVHRVEHREQFSGKSGEMKNVDVTITYLPLIYADEQIGVIEIYDDATPLFDQLRTHSIQIVLIVLGAFGYLFLALYFSISKTDRAVAQWQDSIAENEEALREAQFIGGLGSYSLDFATGIIKSSDVLDKLFGIDNTYEHTLEGWLALIHPDDREMALEHINKDVIGNNKAFDKEYRIIRHNDQAVRWMHGLGELKFDDDGKPSMVRGTVQDITQRKLAEIELRVAAATFDTQDAILITDARSNIVRVNQAFSEITGFSAEEVIGKNPRIMSSGRHDRAFYIEMWQRLLHMGAWAGEVFDRRKNGEVYPKWMTITAVKNEQHETTHFVAIFSDITARKRIEEEIHNLAFYDALTRLPNRRLFLDRLRAALAASTRRNDYGAVLFIDLDRFKALNDTHGHDCGDMLLIEVGARIKSCVREMDTVARFGGDEFVVLIDAASNERKEATQKVALVAEKIREALSHPYILKEHEHHCSPSIGISVYHGNEVPMERLIEHADMAMYQAKNSGRNAVRFFDPVMQENVAQHDALDNDLHHAIALQQLHLHYQVQVDKDNRPLGAEAFLRWDHPERGILMPGQFLPIAEESNLITDIGHWVLQSACRQLVQWAKEEKTRKLTLTVNISARHFTQPDFVKEVSDILHAEHADPSLLKLELSERLVLTDVNSTVDKIHDLKKIGVRLTMDNFGTVYSSLSYLKQLSSDQLKIHQEFVQGISHDGNDAQLVQTIIDLAKSLDLNIFAEGVETEEQRNFLDRHNCDSYQGYLFGKPVSIGEFDAAIVCL